MGGNKKNSSKNKSNANDENTNNKIQAVILADSFTNTCRPISLEMPKVLFPLCGTPMLDYVLEFLEAANIDEVLVFCSSFPEKIEEFLANSRWKATSSSSDNNNNYMSNKKQSKGNQPRSNMVVKTVTSSQTQNAGDALRELDSQKMVTTEPFVLISGDVVCNIDLASVIQAHKERFEKDKENIMTVVLKKASPEHRTRSIDDDLVVVLDSETKQIVKYDNEYERGMVDMEASFFAEHAGVEFRYDLMDCNVDVCSIEMIARVADEYDYKDLRKDFIRQEVQNKELGHKIYGHIVENEYAARVHDPRTYDAVCRDVIRRWAYPMVPDNNLYGTSFVYSRINRYKEADVTLAWSATVGSDTVIGARTKIGNGTKVNQSVLGRDCTIGDNVQIIGSHIWDNVTIEDGAIVEESIICNGALIRKGARISRGSIISFNVIIGENFVVEPFAKITCVSEKKEEEKDEYGHSNNNKGYSDKNGTNNNDSRASPIPADESVVGKNGKGRLWHPLEEIHEDEIQEVYGGSVGKAREIVSKLSRRASMGAKALEAAVANRWHDWKEAENAGSMMDVLAEVGNQENAFEDVVLDMILTSYNEGLDINNLELEIGCYKRAENMGWDETAAACMPAILTLTETTQKGDQKGLMKSIQAKFKEFERLIEKLATQGEEVQHSIISSVEDYVLANPAYLPQFPVILMTIHNMNDTCDSEVLCDEVLEEWKEQHEKLDDSNPAKKLLSKNLLAFFEHAVGVSSEEEEDDDDDDDSSGEDSD